MINKDYLYDSEISYIKGSLINIPSTNLLPDRICIDAVISTNGKYLNCSRETLSGSSVGLNKADSFNGTIGELCERYSASYNYQTEKINGTYNSLKAIYNLITPKSITFFKKEQYLKKDFNLVAFDENSSCFWIKCVDLINNKFIYLPEFLVLLEPVEKEIKYVINTSTGIAAHISLEKAITAAFLECVERHDFSNIWYNQNNIQPIKYNPEIILDYYKEDEKLNLLLSNSQVKIVVLDLCKTSILETAISIIFFKHNNRELFTIGSATRFNKKDAIIKSILEAYQGIEYTKSLLNMNLITEAEKENFNKIDSFTKHFSFYNVYPEFLEEVPFFKFAKSKEGFSKELVVKELNHTKLDRRLCNEFNINKLYYTVLTTPDVKEIGMEVVRVVVPEFTLLTSHYKYPFLGNKIFEKNKKIFTNFPHPFP